MQTQNTLPTPLSAQNVHLAPEPAQLSPADISHLTADEHETLLQEYFRRLKDYTGAARDAYQQQINDLLGGETRSAIWEENRALITHAMMSHLQLQGTVPSKTKLSLLTGLSRQTIHRHLKEYNTSPYIADELNKLKVISADLMFQLSKQALGGCIKSAKLFFMLTGHLRSAGSHYSIFSQTTESYRPQTTSTSAAPHIGSVPITQQDINKLPPDEQLRIADLILKYK